MKSATPQAPGRLWAVAHRRDNNEYGLALVAGGKVEWQTLGPAQPPITYPQWVSGAGRDWLFGYSGLFRTNPSAPWRLAADNGVSGQRFRLVPGQLERGALHLQRWPLGTSRMLPFLPGRLVRGARRLLASDFRFGSAERCCSRAAAGFTSAENRGRLDLDFLQAPGDPFVNIAVEDGAGAFWLWPSEGVLRYQPSGHPPETRIYSSVTAVRSGSALPVIVRGLSRFEREIRPSSFRYAWRIDGRAMVALWTVGGGELHIAGAELG